MEKPLALEAGMGANRTYSIEAGKVYLYELDMSHVCLMRDDQIKIILCEFQMGMQFYGG